MSSERNLVLTTIEAIAEVEGVEPHELEYTLQEHVYTGAIRGLSDGEYEDWSLTFRVPGHEVTVRAGGSVHVDGRLVRDDEEP